MYVKRLESNNKVLLVHDVYDINKLKDFLHKNTDIETIIDVGPTFYLDYDGLEIFQLGNWLLGDIKGLELLDLDYNEKIKTLDCFNFAINKKTLNRYILLKLLEHFNLATNSYTWFGFLTYDMSEVLDLIKDFPKDIDLLGPITKIQPRYFLSEGEYINGSNRIEQARDNNIEYAENLRTVFERSAVSLITESSVDDKNATSKQIHYSEKTIYSVTGLTFPIWVGGYAQAEHWQNFGFDVFDDVIDHSYQYYDNFLLRCYHAINDNIKILSDINLATTLREKNLSRLINNRKLLLKDNIILKWHRSQIDNLPEDVANTFRYAN